MTVRVLRAKQRGPNCSYCANKAKWRGVYFTRFACAEHEGLLRTADAEQERRDACHSEADWYAGVSA